LWLTYAGLLVRPKYIPAMLNQLIRVYVAIALVSLGVVSVRAASVTYNSGYTWTNNPNLSASVVLTNIPPFNPAMGTLTNVTCGLFGLRTINWSAYALAGGGTYSIGAIANFVLTVPGHPQTGFPEAQVIVFSTPRMDDGGSLQSGESRSGFLQTSNAASATLSAQLERFTNGSVTVSCYPQDGGYVGTGGNAGFSLIDREALALVSVTYEYTPAPGTIVAPTLFIAPAAPGFVTINWLPDTLGFILQENLTLTTNGWSNTPAGFLNPITLPVAPEGKFFRLIYSP
jgi:hypothetical protein